MQFFLTLTWNFNTASNSERISEFEAFKKKAEVKGTITDWVIEYQPSSGHAHVHCLYQTSFKSASDIKYAFKRKGLHIHPVPVKKGTDEHLKGYIHKTATKAPHSDDAVVERTSSDDTVEDSWVPTMEWRDKLRESLKGSIKPIPLSVCEFF